VCLYLLLRQEREEEVSSLASSRQTVLEVRVPLDSVSYVIGRQGANIKEVQAKTDTRINFRDEVAGELYRVCLVRGSPADCQMAEILIQQMLARQARPEVVELAVPTRAVGRIIGRAGETVRSIQRLSGAKVDVERADSGEERRVTLRGTREDIETAQKMIEEKVKEEELTRLSVTSRPPRIKYKQPLFLNYDQNSDEETMGGAGEREAEQLEPSASDNCMEVLVSAISSPGECASVPGPGQQSSASRAGSGSESSVALRIIDISSEEEKSSSAEAVEDCCEEDEDMEDDLLFDTHCHIDFLYTRRLGRKLAGQSYSRLVAEFPALHSVRLHGFITNFCDPACWPREAPPALLCSAWADGVNCFYTLGCHPHYAPAMLEPGAAARLERLLVQGRGRGCVAVGECGLDLSRNSRVPLAVQQEAFTIQIQIALRLHLPLVLHIRDAEAEGGASDSIFR